MKMFVLLTLMIQMGSCNSSVKTAVKFNVKDFNSSPVSNADVSINGTKVCTTNTKGSCQGIADLNKHDSVKVKIEKNEDFSYWAPFEKSIGYQELRNTEFEYSAILYYLPKSTQQNAFNENTEKSENNVTSKDMTPEPEVGTSQTTITQPLIDENHQEIAESPSPQVHALASSEPANVEEDLGNQERAMDSEVKRTTSKAEDGLNPIKMTIQSLSKAKPVDAVEIFIEHTVSKTREHICTTNVRGRCVLSLSPKYQGNDVRFYAYKMGFEKQFLNTKIRPNQTLRFNLNIGSNVEVQFVQKVYHRTMPVDNVGIIQDERKLAHSDENGVVLLDKSQLSSQVGDISFVAQNYLPDLLKTKTDIFSDTNKIYRFWLNHSKPHRVRISFVVPRDFAPNEMRLVSSLRRVLLGSNAFIDISSEIVQRGVDDQLKDLFLSGAIKKYAEGIPIDAAIIVDRNHENISFSLFKSSGELLYKTSMQAKSDLFDDDRIHAKLKEEVTLIYNHFPFELAIGEITGPNKAAIFLSEQNPIKPRPNEQVSIYDASGNSKIADAIIQKFQDSKYYLELTDSKFQNAKIEVGYKVILTSRGINQKISSKTESAKKIMKKI